MNKSRELSPDDVRAKEEAAAHRARVIDLREVLIGASSDQGEARRLWGRAHPPQFGEQKLRHFHQLLVRAGLYSGEEPRWELLRPKHSARFGRARRLA